MKNFIISLILASSSVIHTHAADLEKQLLGYWKPNMEKTIAAAKKANVKMEPFQMALIAGAVVEFEKDQLCFHNSPELINGQEVPCTVKAVDENAKTITLNLDGVDTPARLNDGKLELKLADDPWVFYDRMSEEDFERRRAAKLKEQAEFEAEEKAEKAKAMEAAWAKPIPDQPAAGKIYGKEFTVEKAVLERSGSLTLRTGKEFFADMEFGITFFNQGDLVDGSRIILNPKESNIAHITMSIKKTNLPDGETFSTKCSLRMELGTAKDGKIPGKIELRMPDKDKSFVVGSFEAEIK